FNKTEVDALLDDKLNFNDQFDAYTNGEDDTLLLLKANQSTTYIKAETDYLISQIEVGDVDLSGYMTLDISQAITANKTFYNACRFIRSIDGMGIIIGASFIKSGVDDSIVLLGAGGTKLISEFSSSVDDSNYVKNTVIGNLTATSFIKSGQDDTSFLLAGDGDRLLSDFSNGSATVEILASGIAINETASEFGLQQEQVAVVAQVAQDNVL
ncbi:MAG: hypothetical protein EZS28_049764, partial [Streblomastix strix]